MLYNVLSQERPHTRPSRFVDGGRRRPRVQSRRAEVMSFSVDLPEYSDVRGAMAPVYVADRYARPQTTWTQPGQQPVNIDTERREAPLISLDGMRVGAALILLAVVGVILLGIWSMSFRQLLETNAMIDANRSRIDEINRNCAEVETRIAASASEINVPISAVEMGMVSAKGVKVIYLNVPASATFGNPAMGMMTGDYLASMQGN